MIRNEKHRCNLAALRKASIIEPKFLDRLSKADSAIPNLVVNTYLLRLNCGYLKTFQAKRHQLVRSLKKSIISGSNAHCLALENLRHRIAMYENECECKRLVIERLLKLIEESLNETQINKSNRT
jgi:hypothetical protein